MYESIRDKCAGKSKKDSQKYNQCQSKAAAIYNAQAKKPDKPSLASAIKREKGRKR
jgi:predicted transcriptional regulator